MCGTTFENRVKPFRPPLVAAALPPGTSRRRPRRLAILQPSSRTTVHLPLRRRARRGLPSNWSTGGMQGVTTHGIGGGLRVAGGSALGWTGHREGEGITRPAGSCLATRRWRPGDERTVRVPLTVSLHPESAGKPDSVQTLRELGRAGGARPVRLPGTRGTSRSLGTIPVPAREPNNRLARRSDTTRAKGLPRLTTWTVSPASSQADRWRKSLRRARTVAAFTLRLGSHTGTVSMAGPATARKWLLAAGRRAAPPDP